jgi:DNA-directed RNA polymerase subunit omega
LKQPSLDQLQKIVGSKYALAVLAARRARMLTESQFADQHPRGTKPVTVALHEIAEGKIKYEWGKKKA